MATHKEHIIKASRGLLCRQESLDEVAQIFNTSPVQKLEAGEES